MKKYLISFFVGILIFGLGIGISFAEVLSFEYKGEKTLGDNIMATEENILYVTDNQQSIIYDEDIDTSIIVDNNIKSGEIKLEVNYNKQYQELEVIQSDNKIVVRLFVNNKYVTDLLNNIKDDLKKSDTYIYKTSAGKAKLNIYVNETDRDKIILNMITNF